MPKMIVPHEVKRNLECINWDLSQSAKLLDPNWQAPSLTHAATTLAAAAKASMLAHPVGWAIGATAVCGIGIAAWAKKKK